MRKVLKIVAGIGAFLVVVLIGLFFLARTLITAERVKALVLPKVEQALHRQVSLGEVQVGLFSGIELHDLKVAERNEVEPLFSAGLIKLRYQLLPLLSRQVVIDEIRIERPQISLVRQVDGTLSIADLLAPAKTPAAGGGGGGEGGGSGISLLVARVAVSDGRLLFIDRQVAPTAPARIELTGLATEFTEFSLQGSLPIKLRAALNGAPLALDGQLRLAEKAGAVTFDLQGFDATTLAPYYRDKLPGQLAAAKVDLKGTFDGNAQLFTVRGLVGIRDLSLRLKALPQAPFEGVAASADIDLAADLGKGVLTISKGAFDLNGVKLTAGGALRGLTAAPEVDLQVGIPGVELRTLLTALPAGLVGKAASFDLAGSVRGSLTVKGPLADGRKLLRDGELVLEQVHGTVAGLRPSLDGRVRFAGEQLQADALTVRIGQESAQLKVLARNLFGKPIVINADLNAARFPVELFTGGGGGQAAAPASTTAASASTPAVPASGAQAGDKEPGPFDLPVQASGAIRIGEGGWKGLTVRNFLAEYELRDNQLNIRRMTGNVAGGSFSNTASVDLRQPGLAYATSIRLQGVEMQILLPAVAPAAANSLYGRLDLQADVAGRGTRWANLSRNLNGDVAMALANGKLVSPALVKGFADFLQLPDLHEIVFTDFRSKAHLADGTAAVEGALVSNRIRLFPHGSVGLDGSLNLAMDTRLAPDLSARLDQRGKVTRYLTDQEGWTQVPLLLTGTVKAPRYGLDPKGVQAQAGKVLEKELMRGLDKLLNKSKPQSPAPEPAPAAGQAEPPPASPPPASPTQRLLDESLKKLLGK